MAKLPPKFGLDRDVRKLRNNLRQAPYGGRTNDTLYAAPDKPNNDTLFARFRNSALNPFYGGAGVSKVLKKSRGAVMDTIYAGDPTGRPGWAMATVYGGGENDRPTQLSGRYGMVMNTLYGGAGNDMSARLLGRHGVVMNTVYGGAGNDARLGSRRRLGADTIFRRRSR